MKYLYIVIISIALAACSNHINPELTEIGVSKQLAEFRKEQLSDVKYILSFDIPEKRTDSIAASVEIQTSVADKTTPIILDFKPDNTNLISVQLNGKNTDFSQENEHIIIPIDALSGNKASIKILFTAGEMSLNRQDNYLFTLLVPDRARTLFPCFDQPDIKANYQLNISTLKKWKVITAAKLDSENVERNSVFRNFAWSDKMSTYLFSFVAGEFSEEIRSFDDFKMHFLYQETDEKKIKNSVDTIFAMHRMAIEYLEKYTQEPFPFQKLDFASIYSHPYGGMEHVGAIQYYQGRVFLDKGATQTQELARAKLIAHETAHMWFGDLVTMKWFDDVWLKEVFANFFADKMVNPAFPNMDHQLKFVTSHYPNAYSIDRTKGTHPIRQELKNLNNAGSLYGNIIYYKAPIMMRQLEALLGEDKFQEGIREYIHTYKNSNADWNDLIEILDQKTDMNLDKWSQNWVHTAGRPVFEAKISYNKQDKIKNFRLQQSAEDGSGAIWPQTFDISFIYPDTIITTQVQSTKHSVTIDTFKNLSKPQCILYNSNGLGYGLFPTDSCTQMYAQKIKNNVPRSYCYINSFENCLMGQLSVSSTFQSLLNGLKQEKNELILNLIANQSSKIFWKYLNIEDRDSLQYQMEDILYKRMQKNEDAGIKKTLFHLYQSIAYQGKGLTNLYNIWNKTLKIPQLILNDDDYTDMAMHLALYKHPDSDTILERAEKAITDSNQKQRFLFIKPALSDDAGLRSRFFNSFKDDNNRSIENWVLTACAYLHHPLRQQTAISDISLSLHLLEEIQQTGDIFFPKNWLDNTIGQYTSMEAYEEVNDFLEEHPDLDAKLRNKILQSTDDLFRVQTIFAQ